MRAVPEWPDIAYELGTFMYLRSFLDYAAKLGQASQAFQAAGLGTDEDQVTLPDGSCLCRGKEAVIEFENAVGRFVRKAAFDQAVAHSPHCQDGPLGGCVIHGFKDIRTTDVVYLHAWSEHFLDYPKSNNFAVVDILTNSRRVACVFFSACRGYSFPEVWDLDRFLIEHKFITGANAAMVNERIVRPFARRGKTTLECELDLREICERELLTILGNLVDFGMSLVRLKEIRFSDS